MNASVLCEQKYTAIHKVAGNEEELKHDVCDFIVEIGKENGEQYPSSSLHDLLQGLSIHLKREHNLIKNKLIDKIN